MNVNSAAPMPVARPEMPPVAGGTQNYTVKAGDSLWQIAQRELGNGDAWPELYAQNQSAIGSDPNRLQPGLVLQLRGAASPVAAPSSPENTSPDTPAAQAYETYTVKAGDSLWKIAQQALDNGAAWPELHALNRDLIGDNPDRLQPGMVLKLRPAAATPSESPTPAPQTAPEAAPELGTEPTRPPADLPATGSATPSVTLLEDADLPEIVSAPATAPVEAEPETAPQVMDAAPAAPVAPAADAAPVLPAAIEVAHEDSSLPPALEPAAADVPPVVVEAEPATAQQVMDAAPAAPVSPAAETAPGVPAVTETAPVLTSPAPTLEPATADVPPVVEAAPVEPVQAEAELALAEELLVTLEALETAATVETQLSDEQAALQAQVGELLGRVDGKGYTASQHGDPVGGIPQVARAMGELLALYNRGELANLPAGESRERAEHWALETAAARTGKELQRWDGFSEAGNQLLIEQVKSPAFQALPPERQARLAQQAQLSHEILSGLPHLRHDQQAALTALSPWLSPAAASSSPANTQIETAVASPEYQAFEATLQRSSSRWGSFTHHDKTALLTQQAEALWTQEPDSRAQLATALSQGGQLPLAGQLLRREPTLAAELLQQPGFPAVKLLDEADDATAIDLLISLAQKPGPAAERVLSETLKEFDAFFSFQDRKAPFAQLTQDPAFAQLTPELQTRIRDFVS